MKKSLCIDYSHLNAIDRKDLNGKISLTKNSMRGELKLWPILYVTDSGGEVH